MQPIAIHIKEDFGIQRIREPIQIGVPLPKGALANVNNISLVNSTSNDSVLGQFTPLAKWPDGSIRWLQVNTLMDMRANETVALAISQVEPSKSTSALTLTKNSSTLCVNTGIAQFEVSTSDLSWSQISENNAPWTHKALLKDDSGETCSARFAQGWQIINQGPISLTLEANGTWHSTDDKRVLNFCCSLTFYNDSETIKVELRAHNPNRAQHPGGLWDLGDSGSVLFKSLGLEITSSDFSTIELESEQASQIVTKASSEGLRIYQDSSGGENWNCSNHIDASGQVTTKFKGYKVTSGDSDITNGSRATPIVRVNRSQNDGIQTCFRNFWQNFPSAIEATATHVNLDAFPACDFLHELQGGERKTHTLYINYSSNKHALLWTRTPLTPMLESDWYEATQAIPWFKRKGATTKLDELISVGLEGASNFFAKREAIDEYGWRNFGEIFADHETLYQDKHQAPFISHYNNQYDAIYGFARQFMRSGDSRWFTLMDDLALHVNDIDIYHTNEDRGEYNNGLFWHTDHYLDAHTATHRTYSRHNDTSSIPGQTGGGPAAEHCYSTGLANHYWLTGNSESKASAIKLAQWLVNYYEGDSGLLAQVFAIKKHDLPKLKSLLRGEDTTSHRYPFTRGTGNYINALLDAWHLTMDDIWLQRAEQVIKSTIHPNDNLEKRDLLNAEVSWSYLILITSISKYLLIKNETGNLDASYQYTLASFVHYTRWMADNERTFLSDPEALEFPNDTWTAQDIRKAMLLYQAAYFDPSNEDKYRSKANEWLEATLNALKASPESHFSRILVVLMQNYGPQDWILSDHPTINPIPIPSFDESPQLTLPALLFKISKKLLLGLVQFRPAKEREWLNARLDKS